jgi:type II secretory pathway pseudopilin PulG
MGSNNSLITDDRSRNRVCGVASRRAVALSESGFTLVELLIAAAITVIIVVMLGLMLGSLMSSASHASQRVDAFRDARAALQIMERDFGNLVRTQWNPDPFSSPAPTAAPQPVTRPAAYFAAASVWQPGPSDPPDPFSAGSPNGQIFALISTKSSGSATPTPSAGDVCAVGYYCRWEGNRYTLRRFFSNSTATFNVMTSPIVTAANYASATASPSPALYTPSANDEVLAAYVWNLNIAMYSGAGTPITYPYICDPSATTPALLPTVIEISFNAMSPQAARTVMSVSSTPTDWMDPTNPNYQRLILPHMYQFRTRINLQ